MDKQQLQNWIEAYLEGTDYELITLEVSAGNDILVEIDRLQGVDVDFCAELNRYLVEKLDHYAEGTKNTEHGTKNTEQGIQSTEHGTQNTEHGIQSTEQGTKNTEHGTKNTEHGIQSTEQGTKNTEHGIQNTEHGTQNKERRAQNTEHGIQNTEHGIQNTEHGIQNTEHGTQNTEHGIQNTERRAQSELDYSLEVGSVSLTDPFKTKMQYEKNLGHDVEVMVVESQGSKDRSSGSKAVKYHGQLVSVDEETFSVDVEEKVAVEGKKRKELQVVTYTWRYDEPKYVKYDLKF